MSEVSHMSRRNFCTHCNRETLQMQVRDVIDGEHEGPLWKCGTCGHLNADSHIPRMQP